MGLALPVIRVPSPDEPYSTDTTSRYNRPRSEARGASKRRVRAPRRSRETRTVGVVKQPPRRGLVTYPGASWSSAPTGSRRGARARLLGVPGALESTSGRTSPPLQRRLEVRLRKPPPAY